MPSKRSSTVSTPSSDVPKPIATVYQNSEQIAGILQQLLDSPLILDGSNENSTTNTDSISGGGTADASAALKSRVLPGLPAILGLDAAVKASGDVAGTSGRTTAQVSRQQFAYTQAYNLHLALGQLGSKGHVKTFDDDPKVGDFVKYEAAFDPAELTILLDVLSPELVGAIAKFVAQRSWASALTEAPSRDEVLAVAARMEIDTAAKRDLAVEVARGFQSDSRQLTTREYYARVDDDRTAVTVCDVKHFIVDDPDRLLDGKFTVLGKVLTDAETNAPTFSRNKLLRNIAPDALDEVIAQLQSALATSKFGSSRDSLLDWKLTSRVLGQSWRVMPLAIFV